jgi:hypothetical protein
MPLNAEMNGNMNFALRQLPNRLMCYVQSLRTCSITFSDFTSRPST